MQARVENKLREGVAHKILNVIDPHHDAAIGLSMFIAQAGQYSVQPDEERIISSLLSASHNVSIASILLLLMFLY
jgi:hypothetical protein